MDDTLTEAEREQKSLVIKCGAERRDERLAERQLWRLLSPSPLRFSLLEGARFGIHIRTWLVPMRGYCSGRDIKLCDGVRAVLASSVITLVDNLLWWRGCSRRRVTASAGPPPFAATINVCRLNWKKLVSKVQHPGSAPADNSLRGGKLMIFKI